MNEFFSWEMLASLTGAIAAVTLITQLLKQYINLEPKLIALGLTVLIEAAVQVFYWQDWSAGAVALMLINCFVVLSAAIGSFELALKSLEEKVVGTGK